MPIDLDDWVSLTIVKIKKYEAISQLAYEIGDPHNFGWRVFVLEFKFFLKLVLLFVQLDNFYFVVDLVEKGAKR